MCCTKIYLKLLLKYMYTYTYVHIQDNNREVQNFFSQFKKEKFNPKPSNQKYFCSYFLIQDI